MSISSSSYKKHLSKYTLSIIINIVIIAFIVVFIRIICNNHVKENSDELHNELWSWSENLDYDRTLSVGWYETFFFSSTGRFMYIKEFSSDDYIAMWSTGSYTYNRHTDEITMTTDNSNMSNQFGNSIIGEQTIVEVVAKTDSTITLAGAPITSREKNIYGVTVFQRKQQNLLMFPESSLNKEVVKIEMLKKSGKKIYEMNEKKRRFALNALNSSIYNREWNLESAKLPIPDFNLYVHYDNGEMLSIEVWTQEMKLKIANVWYDFGNNPEVEKFIELLKDN